MERKSHRHMERVTDGALFVAQKIRLNVRLAAPTALKNAHALQSQPISTSNTDTFATVYTFARFLLGPLTEFLRFPIEARLPGSFLERQSGAHLCRNRL
jgi:hypothetical protein